MDRYDILDTPTEPIFDDIARLASEALGAPIAVVNLIATARQWFKAEISIGARELPLEVSICAHALLEEDMMVIPDTRLDPRVDCNPLVTAEGGLRFYAGALLKTPDGLPIGTLCVLDRQPRPEGITPFQRLTLEVLARQVMTQLELRRSLSQQQETLAQLAASEERTRLALDAGELGAWESTPALRSLKWDARTRELLGHEPDEALDYETSFLARVHAEDRERVAALIAEALAPGGAGTVSVEYRTVNPRDGRERWIHAKGALAVGLGGEQKFVGTVRDITAEKDAEMHRRLLTGELQHRVKNTLAVVNAIVHQSLRSAPSMEEASTAIGQRLQTLGAAYELLTRTDWTVAPIGAVAEGTTALHGARTGAIRIAGPDLLLSARASLALSMSLHELSTNAVKYGALSVPGGQVDLTWTIDAEEGKSFLTICWEERGGPTVCAPERGGFGTRLMASLASDLGGKGVIDYQPTGVVWRHRADLARITEPA
ncbi:PAS domain S-box protein (plasmid) [Sphingobium amiense]|uniref:histidine kinase n=1 Tax=Sphingobium amiense TaxID=135719 RepID=A0A494WGI1_9SPHN|nr:MULTISPECIES: HWE histidine kinase domain-containing protein [Sphingomonadaceae]BBE00231.1 PAS domain S-box protein [Sphingobium amiense]